MEWGTVVTLISTGLSTLLGGGVIVNVWTQRRQRREKQQERELARLDTHRVDLRQAHATLIGAYSRALEMGTRLAAWHSLGPERLKAAVPEGMGKLLNEYFVSCSDAQAHLAQAMLLEDRLPVIDRLHKLYALGPIVNIDNSQETDRELHERYAALHALLLTLIGSFAPKNWDARRSVTGLADFAEHRQKSLAGSSGSSPRGGTDLGEKPRSQ
jgi:hypothetical protein